MGESGSLYILAEDVVDVLVRQTLCWDGAGGVCEAVGVVEQAERVGQKSLRAQEGEFAGIDWPCDWLRASAASNWEWEWVAEARAFCWTSRTRR